MLRFAHRLAFLFGRPVSELNISMREFFHWVAYLEEEPPDKGENMRTAALLAQITNMSGKSLPAHKRVTADDFYRAPTKRQSKREQIDFFKHLGKANDG